MFRSQFKLLAQVVLVASLAGVTSCGSSGTSTSDSQPSTLQLESLQATLAGTYSGEEAFAFGNLDELRGRSSVGLLVTIVAVEPGPAEIMAQTAAGEVVVNETLAISLKDDKGKDHLLVQDYGEAIGFEAVASQFPVGAKAVVFGLPFSPPERRKKSEKFDTSKAAKWQLAHPLGFFVLSADNVLIPLFSEHNSSPKISDEGDKKFLRSLGLEVTEIRWPAVDG